METPRGTEDVQGTPNGTPRGTPPPAVSPARRTSMSRATADSPAPVLALEINKLRNELRAKAVEANDLAVEVRTLQMMISTKDAAIEAAETRCAAMEEQSTELMGQAAEFRRASAKWEQERKRLRASLDAANDEADRLNQVLVSSSGDSSKVMNGSMEDVVRLHNQLAESRKEIRRLKEETKGSSNVMAAKDKAIDEMTAEIAAAKEANATRRDDQNIILDLRRQLTEAHKHLGGQKKIGHLVESEVDELKDALAAKDEELAGSAEYLKTLNAEVTALHTAVAAAERAAATAKVEAAEAKSTLERAKISESERMKDGGLIPRAEHDTQIAACKQDTTALQHRIAAMTDEVHIARAQRERLLDAVDDAVVAAVGGSDVAGQVATTDTAIEELRAQIKELRSLLASKDAASAALLASREDAVARAAREKLAAHKIKARLAEAIGDYAYSMEFHEPPPGPESLALKEAEAAAAEEEADAVGVSAVAAQRDAAILEATQATAVARVAELAAEKAAVDAKDAANSAREEAQAAAAAKVAAIEIAMATKQSEVGELQSKVAALQGAVNEVAELRSETAELKQQLETASEAATSAAAAADAQLAEAIEQVEAKDKEVAELRQQMEAAKETAIAASSAAAVEILALQEQLSASRQESVVLQEKVSETEARVIELQTALEAQIEETKSTAIAAAEVESLQAQLQEKLETVAFLKAHVEELTATKESYEAILETTRAAEAEELNAVKEAVERETARASALEEQLSEALEKLQVQVADEQEESKHSLATAAAAVVGIGSAAAVAGGVAGSLIGEVPSEEESATATPPQSTTFNEGLLSNASPREIAAAAAAASGGPSSADGHLNDLVFARVEIAELKQENDDLKSQVAALTPPRAVVSSGVGDVVDGGQNGLDYNDQYDQEEDEEEEDEEEEIIVMNVDSEGVARAPKFQENDASTTAGVTPAALGEILDKLVAARAAGGGANGNTNSNTDDVLYNEALAMLKSELARLGQEVMAKGDDAARLRSEVGALHTAKMDAAQTASLLEDTNRLMMKVAALKTQLDSRENEYFRCEASLLQDISALNAELKRRRGKGAVKKAAKSASKVVTSAFKGMQKSFDSAIAGAKQESGQRKGTSPFGGLTKMFGSNQSMPQTTPTRPVQPPMQPRT